MKLIKINSSIGIPIYKQIVNSVYEGIQNGKLRQTDALPSVNQIAAEFSLARGSVFSAYNELRAAGVIDSIPGKGYFVKSTLIRQTQNIFLLFSTFTAYKEILYNAILKNLNETCIVDIYFHHHNFQIFETLIRERSSSYNTFVIMPEVHEKTIEILEILNPKKTYLLDVGLNEFRDSFAGVYQNFEKDIADFFNNNLELLAKYENMVLIFPPGHRAMGILKGFKKGTKKNGIASHQIPSAQKLQVKKGDCYLTIDDNDMVGIVTQAKAKGLKLGIDIGILSYNESELKGIIADGITTITTDFEYMGKRIAEMILSGEQAVIENPFLMVKRNSV